MDYTEKTTVTAQQIIETFRDAGYPSVRYPDVVTRYATVYAGVADEVQRAADVADDLDCWLVVTPAPGIFGIVPR